MTYGTGTRSWNRSTEKRQMDAERAEYTRAVEAGEIPSPFRNDKIRDYLICECRSFRYRHTLEAHKKLKADHDWRGFEQRERDEARQGFWRD